MNGRRLARRSSLIVLKSIEVSFSLRWVKETWNDPSGKPVETCSIFTTTPNALTARVHDRMPVIPEPQCYDLGLDPGVTNVKVISEFLKPFDDRLMGCFPVSSRVNQHANDDAECSESVEIIQSQGSLFS
jgi:putative SOS response-associated peptidase YedK